MKYTSTLLLLTTLLFSCQKKNTYSPPELTVANAMNSYLLNYNSVCSRDLITILDSLPMNVRWENSYQQRINGENCLLVGLAPSLSRRINNAGNIYSPYMDRYLLFRKNKGGDIYFEVVGMWFNGNPEHKLSILVFDNKGKLKSSFVSDGKKDYPGSIEFLNHNGNLSRTLGGALCTETDWYSCVYFHGVNLGCSYNYTIRQCLDLPDAGGGIPSIPKPTGNTNFSYTDIAALRFTHFYVNPPADRLIHDLPKYLSCFTINNSSSYSVSICVKQPIPNSRIVISDAYKHQSPAELDLQTLTVGHAFLTFSQTSAGLPAVIRSVGFYPGTMVSPFIPETEGAVADNSNLPYTVSVTFKLSAAQFKTMLEAFKDQVRGPYNLNWNNCTTACIDVVNTAGLKIPRTNGTWPLGGGPNPADLGEDIRNFNSEKIISKVLNGGKSPENSAPCN